MSAKVSAGSSLKVSSLRELFPRGDCLIKQTGRTVLPKSGRLKPMGREDFMARHCMVALLMVLITWAPLSALTMEPPKKEVSPASVSIERRCFARPDPGPCYDRIEKYYYDGQHDTCKPFFWSGCQGIIPFESMKACASACMDKSLHLAGVKPMTFPVYAEVTVTMPAAFRKSPVSLSVNGETVNYQNHPVYSLVGADDYPSSTLRFFPGSRGVKQVTVSAVSDKRTIQSSVSFFWEGLPFVAVVNHFGEEELVTAKKELSVVAVNTDAVRILFNGVEVTSDSLGREARIFTFQPEWKAGKNELTIDGRSSDGKPVRQHYSFFFAENGIVRPGDKMFIRYEDEGVKGKSGPWFDVQVDGEAVRAAERDRTVKTCVLSDDGWLSERGSRILGLTAVAPGTATVRIVRNARFLESPGVEREIVLRIVSP